MKNTDKKADKPTYRQIKGLLKRALVYVPKSHYELRRPIEKALNLPRL